MPGFNLSLPMMSSVTHSFASYRVEMWWTSIIPFIYLTSYAKGDFFFLHKEIQSLNYLLQNKIYNFIKVVTYVIKYIYIYYLPSACSLGPYSRPRAQFFPIRTDLGLQITCFFFSSVEYFVSSFFCLIFTEAIFNLFS